MCGIIPVFIQNPRDWLAIFLSAAIPVLVMVVTLLVSRQQQKNALKQQDFEHKAALSQQASQHQDILKKQNDAYRLSIMPVFDVVSITGKVKSFKPFSTIMLKHILEITLKNVGNGAAMCTYTKWVNGSNKLEYHPVHEDDYASYTCYKEFQYDNTIATIGKEIDVMLERKSKGKDYKTFFDNSLILPVSYFDLIGNHYIQNIVVHFHIIDRETGEIEPFNIMPLPPDLIEDNTRDNEQTDGEDKCHN